jgi:transposase-like protein
MDIFSYLVRIVISPTNTEVSMSSCPRCGSDQTVSNGSVRGVSKRRCKACSYQFTRADRPGKPLSVKLLAVALYLHGLSMNAIAKLIGVSTPAVLKWIRLHAQTHCPKPTPGEAVIVELDEMWHFLQKKTASSGSGKLFVVIQGDSLIGNAGIVITLPSNT